MLSWLTIRQDDKPVLFSNRIRILTEQIRFNDGAAYERYMGKWSQLAGQTFLDWLGPEPGMW